MKFLIAQATKSAARLLVLCLSAVVLLAQSRPVDPDLTAHEWGTFTSVVGTDGQAVEWTPLIDTTNELPSFVEHLHWVVFKQGLPAMVRMETPVLYFYSSHRMTLSVQATFSKGLITEWYPHAVAPAADGGEDEADLYRKHAANGSISWNSVTLQPGAAVDFPRGSSLQPKMAKVPSDPSQSESRYYAARQTSATPIAVHTAAGEQHEKFLFYRGVSEFSVPISAGFTAQGNLLVRNSLEAGISNVIWFERRGERVGYRIHEGLGEEATLESPDLTGTVEHLQSDLEEMLVAGGLYRDEAQAMIATWRDAWFEEGSRLFYMVPASFVDSVLPLNITPAPAQTVRVFVGRLELISPATQKAVADALASDDQATLDKYRRFLQPILKIVKQNNPEMSGRVLGSPSAPCRVDDAGHGRQQ